MKSILFISSEILSKIIPFLFLPYLTYNLGAKGMGELSLFQMYWAALLPIFNMSFDTCLNRYYIRYGARNYSSVLTVIFIFIFITCLIFSVVFYALNLSTIFFLALYCAVFNALYIILLSALQIRKLFKEYAIYQLANSVVLVLINYIIFEFYCASVDGRALSVIIAFFLSCLVVLIHVKSKLNFKWVSLRILKFNYMFIFSFSSPLLINGMSNFVRNYIDRYFINMHYAIEDLGVYSLAFQLSGIGILIIASLNKMLVPDVYKRMKVRKFRVLPSIKFNMIVLVATLSLLIIAKELPGQFYGFIFGRDFVSLGDFISPLVLFSMMHIYYFYFTNVLMYIGKTKVIMYSTLCSMLFQIPFAMIISPISLDSLVYSPFLSLSFSVLLLIYFIKVELRIGGHLASK
ncbi:TPA: oligosaccharide flippase family protein [Vibrio parahaemolyticus]